jgi:hypothetical protein
LITTGKLDAGAIQIMSGNEPAFRWDAYGISAYDAHWQKLGDSTSVISGIDSKKFVRFDKYGIYGIDNAAGIDGANWHPTGDHATAMQTIEDKSTFALTWKGLKVTGSNGGTALLGK